MSNATPPPSSRTITSTSNNNPHIHPLDHHDHDHTALPIKQVDLVVVGGGPAGMAAIEARGQGIEDILILEREPALGGILNQCIHDGFGLEIFREALTGPEYMRRYIKEVEKLGIPYLTNCMVLDLTSERTIIASTPDGLQVIQAGAIILAMGCRERSRGAIRIPGSRPAGIYTAGTAQHFINLKDLMVGKRIVILGSGDIGMIMARRLTLEGAKVLAVVEILPYSSGLTRNVVQCLEDYDIPLHLSHTVSNIHGKQRLEAVEISKVDKDLKPIPGTARRIDCDTLLLSVGLIPENELSRSADVALDLITKGAIVTQDLQTSVPGIFACGNVLHVHDVVDWASMEAERAGRSVAHFLSSPPTTPPPPACIGIKAGKGIHYVVPQKLTTSGSEDEVILSFRVKGPDRDTTIEVVDHKGNIITTKTFKRVNPAEMIQMTIPGEKIRASRISPPTHPPTTNSIEVRIKEGGGEHEPEANLYHLPHRMYPGGSVRRS